MKNNHIPIYSSSIGEQEKKYVNECLDTNWISSKGKFVNLFELNFSQFINSNSTSVSNGTVALDLALRVLNIGINDEVIVPTFTYVASVNAIRYVGANPILVDSDIDTWNIDTNKVVKKITKKTKAIMAVHIYGNPCNMKKLQNICSEHNLLLIEDAAEAFGSYYLNKHVGTFGDISTFSFFGNKTITTGEGGMIVSNDLSKIKKCNFLKSQAVSETIEYWHDEIGYNYRMTNIQAAIGLAQLEKANSILKKKFIIANLYKEYLKDTDIIFQTTETNSIHSYWMVAILCSTPEKLKLLRSHLLKNDIETRPFFNPVHSMPVFYENTKYEIANDISARGLNLPSYPDLSHEDIINICEKIKEVI